MTTGHLPTITALRALRFEGAILTLDDGTTKTVRAEDGPYLMGRTCSRLVLWQRGQTRLLDHYRVPAHATGPLTWALALQPCRLAALAEVGQHEGLLTFAALQDGESTYTLTAPRASLLHLDTLDPRRWLLLTVTEVPDPAFSHLDAPRTFPFLVNPDDPVVDHVGALIGSRRSR